MPPRKSVLPLEELCWKTAIYHIEILGNQAKSLPKCFVDEFYKRLSMCDEYNFKKESFILDANQFLHSKSEQLLYYRFDLQPHQKLMKEIISICKNLRKIVMYYFPSSSLKELINLTANNPLLIHLDLHTSAGITDHDLFIICKNCPQLQSLKLADTAGFTDKCMSYLPTTLRNLNLNETYITPTGCLVALNRLKSLKKLKYGDRWIEILEKLMLQQNSKSTFSVECLKVDCTSLDNYDINFGEIVVNKFPKLRRIQLLELKRNSIINSLRKNNKLSLVTHLHLEVSVDSVIPLCRLCPMLEKLSVRISNNNVLVDTYDTTCCEYIPFKHLRKFSLSTGNFNLQLDDFKRLVENFKWLECLNIFGWSQLGDREIYKIVETIPLQRLQTIFLDCCKPFTEDGLRKLISSLDCLTYVKIWNCENISSEECANLEEFIDGENLNVDLYLKLSLL